MVLTENNNDPNCKKQDSILIKVACNAQASFTSSATNINPGGSITFTNTSTGASNYQWYIDGIAQVTTSNFTHTFPTAGGYMVYLVACNNNCCDTSNYQFIKVGMCNSKEGNVWYFGDKSGLDFNSGSPVVLTSPAVYNEGCSSISNPNGQFLFCTNGVTVRDQSLGFMQNGTGLWGHSSTSQSALILQKPGSNTLYYIFTCDMQGGVIPDSAGGTNVGTTPGAFAYSIVDITANGGLGTITSKNNLIYTSTTERQSAVRHSNGTDIWIVTHEWNSDKFKSYLLTCSGLNSTPIISQTGIIHDNADGFGGAAMGYMCISPAGKKLAVAIYAKKKIQLFDFNTTTGVVSNPITIPDLSNYSSYGVAFSPDGSKLYYSSEGGSLHTVYQINVNAGSSAAIITSNTAIGTASAAGALQLGPNGKIYVAQFNSKYLSAINNPNALGTLCNFSLNAVYLNNNESRSGLPNFLVDYFTPKKAADIQGDSVICNSSVYYVTTANNCGLNKDSIAWILHGTSTIVSTVDSAITITPTQVGIDTLISIQYAACGVVSDTLLIHTKTGGPTINLGNDTIICNPISIQLNAGSGYPNYLWSTTATTQTINVLTPGTYWVEVGDTNGCKSRDTIQVVQGNSKPNVNLGTDKIVCPGKVIPMDAGAGYMSYLWYDNSNNQTNTAWLPGTYWVIVVDSCGNSSMDTLKVIADMSGAISVGTDTMLCDNETLVLDAGSGFISYIWQDGSTNQTYTAIDSGVFIVYVATSDGCSYSDTIKIDDCNNIIHINDCEVGIPDAFSPNGDGVNDELHVLGNCIDKITFVVYDRWGEKVFETNSPTQGWDGMHKGKKMDNAVFAYYLKATTLKGTEINLKGNISLIK